MKSKKSNAAAKRRDKRAIDDLSVSDARAKSAKGGFLTSSVSTTVKSIGDALTTAARSG
jgi:hypothetical protein